MPSYLTKMFLQQRLVELGWPTELLFLPLLLGGLACVAGTEVGRRVRCRSMRRLYTACALLCGVGTLLVGAAPAWGGILGMMLVQGVLEVYLLHESQKLNDAIPSDQRATLISVDGMAYSLLMIPASPLVGAVGDAFGQAGAGPCPAGRGHRAERRGALGEKAAGILIQQKADAFQWERIRFVILLRTAARCPA